MSVEQAIPEGILNFSQAKSIKRKRVFTCQIPTESLDVYMRASEITGIKVGELSRFPGAPFLTAKHTLIRYAPGKIKLGDYRVVKEEIVDGCVAIYISTPNGQKQYLEFCDAVTRVIHGEFK